MMSNPNATAEKALIFVVIILTLKKHGWRVWSSFTWLRTGMSDELSNKPLCSRKHS
jgi:hypothetical protein